MTDAVSAIPKGYHSITPAITCKRAATAIEFYKNVFAAEELSRMQTPDGNIAHAEIKIGNSVVFINDEFPGMAAAPAPGASSAFYLFLYTENVDAVFQKALDAGSTPTMPLQDQFWGDRYGKIVDPFGHSWGLAQHIEDVSPEEMQRRSAEWHAKMAKSAGQS